MALVVRELRRGGFEPTFERVDTPAGMTAALGKNQWDLVICDYSMPHFSATDALRLLRTRFRRHPASSSRELSVKRRHSRAETGRARLCHEGQFEALASAIQRELGEAEQRRERKR